MRLPRPISLRLLHRLPHLRLLRRLQPRVDLVLQVLSFSLLVLPFYTVPLLPRLHVNFVKHIDLEVLLLGSSLQPLELLLHRSQRLVVQPQQHGLRTLLGKLDHLVAVEFQHAQLIVAADAIPIPSLNDQLTLPYGLKLSAGGQNKREIRVIPNRVERLLNRFSLTMLDPVEHDRAVRVTQVERVGLGQVLAVGYLQDQRLRSAGCDVRQLDPNDAASLLGRQRKTADGLVVRLQNNLQQIAICECLLPEKVILGQPVVVEHVQP